MPTTTPEPHGCSYRYPDDRVADLACPITARWHLIALDGTTREVYALESCDMHRPQMEDDALVAWVHELADECRHGQFAPDSNRCLPVDASV